MANVDKVKILVVGDSGVGKTSLVHLICQNEPTKNPGWTIGCSVDVKLHEYKAGTAAEKTFFIELWDIGGVPVIRTVDLCSTPMYMVWNSRFDLDPEQFVGNQLPLLVIGTKADQKETIRDKNRQSSVAEEYGADQFDLDNYSVKYLAPGSTNAVKLSRFFDKVIERRYYSRESQAPTLQSHSSPQLGRRVKMLMLTDAKLFNRNTVIITNIP